MGVKTEPACGVGCRPVPRMKDFDDEAYAKRQTENG